MGGRLPVESLAGLLWNMHPFAEDLDFPSTTTRHSRDLRRFLQLIMVVAFLRQKQKTVIEENGYKLIEADLQDYEIAYYYGIKILANTLNPITKRIKKVLITCCALADEKKEGETFTPPEIKKKGRQLNLDLDENNIHRQLDYLTSQDYLDCPQSGSKGKKSYSVCFEYIRDKNGNIINIDSTETKIILTPDQLRQKLASKTIAN